MHKFKLVEFYMRVTEIVWKIVGQLIYEIHFNLSENV